MTYPYTELQFYSFLKKLIVNILGYKRTTSHYFVLFTVGRLIEKVHTKLPVVNQLLYD